MQGKDLRRKTRFPGADKLRHPGEGRDEALDRASEVVGLLAPGHDRIEEGTEHPLHGRDHKLFAVAKVHIEGSPRIAGPGADGIEARRVEAALGELGQSGQEERFACLLLPHLPAVPAFGHGS